MSLVKLPNVCFAVLVVIFGAIFPISSNTYDVDPGGNECEEISTSRPDPGIQLRNLSQESKVDQIIGQSSDILSFPLKDLSGIFVLGISNSEMTTVVEIIAGNLSQLQAIRRSNGEFGIRNQNDHNNWQEMESKALVPEYRLNAKNISFYHCPAFKEGHGADNIASMYVVNAIIEHVNWAKFVFVTNYTSVTTDVDDVGAEFDILASHASRVLLNMNKFSDSILLIVTKVSDDSKTEDDDVLPEVGAFLWNFHSTLENQLTRHTVGTRKWEAHRRKIQFLEAILQTDENGQYSKIAVIKDPTQCGIISRNNYYVTLQDKLADMLNNEVVYTAVNSSEFGFVSQFKLVERIRNKIQQKIVPRIIAVIESDTVTTFEDAMKKYQARFERELSFITDKTAGMQRVETLENILKIVESASTKLIKGARFVDVLGELFIALQYQAPETYLKQVTNQENVLNFYKKVTTDTSTRRVFVNALSMVGNHLRSMKDIVLSSIKNMKNRSRGSVATGYMDVSLTDSSSGNFSETQSMMIAEFEEDKCLILDPPETSPLPVLENSKPTIASKKPEDNMQEILQQGMDQLHFDQNQKAAILVLGNTGSGKTTMTQRAIGNLSQLHAVLTSGGHLVIIDDVNRIGLPTTTSKTLVPEYVVNPENNVAFYDCPGFDDNRGAETDIAAMYFLNTVTENVNRVKFLFTVTYSSTISGNDRSDFPDLAKHAAHFLMSMSKFSNSIGLIVTKVDNFSKLNGRYVSDTIIMNGIVAFLQKYRQTLQEKVVQLEQSGNLNELELNKRKIEFLEAILQQDESGQYSKVWFLRNPLKCGPFSEMPDALVIRKTIADLYMNKLHFASVNSSDFGFTLKDETLLKISSEYVPNIITRIENGAQKVLQNLSNIYQTEFEMEFNKVFQEQKVALMKINGVLSLVSHQDFMQQNKSTCQKIQDVFNSLGYTISASYIRETERYEDLLSFYSRVSIVPLPTPSMNISALRFRNQIRSIKEAAQLKIQRTYVPKLNADIQYKISQEINGLIKSYVTNFETNFTSQSEMKNALLKLDETHTKLGEFKLAKSANKMYVDDISTIFKIMQHPAPESLLNQTTQQEDVLLFYENVTGLIFSRPSADSSFGKLQNRVRDLRETTWKHIRETAIPETVSYLMGNASKLVNEGLNEFERTFARDFSAESRTGEAQLKLNNIYNRLLKFSSLQTHDAMFLQQLQDVVEIVEFRISEASRRMLSKQQDLLSFYETLTASTKIRPSLHSSISKLQAKVQNMRESTQFKIQNTIVPKIMAEIREKTTQTFDELAESYTADFNKKFRNAVYMKDAVTEFNAMHSKIGSYIATNQFIWDVSEVFKILQFPVPDNYLNHLQEWERLLGMYGNITKVTYEMPSFDFTLLKLQKAIQNLKQATWEYVRSSIFPKISSQIKENIYKLTSSLKSAYMDWFRNDLNRITMSTKLATVSKEYLDLESLPGKWSVSTFSSTSLSSEITLFYSKSGVNTGVYQKEQIDQLKDLENTVEFLEKAFSSELLKPYGLWLQSPLDFISNLRDVRDWYDFLIRVDKQLQQYQIQRIINKNRKWDSMELIRHVSNEFVTSNIQRIWGKLRNDDLDRLLFLEITESASSPTNVECTSPTKALITGNYVKFSDFMDNADTLPCYNNAKEITVFATEVVYIDRSVNGEGKGLTITIIANAWSFVGKVGIHLQGSDGLSWNSQAKSGTLSNLNGEAGKPGGHGGNGGNFRGIRLKTVSPLLEGKGWWLTVSGGNGGNGQSGGNGVDAPRGRDAQKGDFPSYSNYQSAVREGRFSTVGSIEDTYHWHAIAGKRITGGNGGDGGARGEAGYHGYVDTYIVGERKTIYSYYSNGQPGNARHGGYSGKGGLRGKYMGGNWRYGKYWDSSLWESWEAPENERAPDGKKGQDGGNSLGQGVRPTKPQNPGITRATILAFKQFINESNNPIGREFVRAMDRDSRISSI